MMRRRGLAPRLLESADGQAPPIVYGEWRVPGATRTYILYAHYDGQPVTPADWTVTPPFQPRRVGEGEDARIYARSASDDKAGVMAILAAVDALRAEGRAPSFNLKIVLEGEEEAGSPNLAALLRRHRETLRSDGWVIIDGPAHQSGPPPAQPRRARRRQYGPHRLRPPAPAPQRPLRQLGAQSGDDARRIARDDEGRDRPRDRRAASTTTWCR